MDDIDLTTLRVREAAEGKEESLEWLVARFSPLLLAQVTHRLGPALRRTYDPEDVVQEVWAVALPRLSGLSPRDGRLTPVVLRFLCTTVLYQVSNLLKRHIQKGSPKPGEDFGVAFSQLPAPTSLAIGRAMRSEKEQALRTAIDALQDVDRQVVILRGIEQNSVQEVASILGLKPNSVTVKYRRALEKLRARLPGSILDELGD